LEKQDKNILQHLLSDEPTNKDKENRATRNTKEEGRRKKTKEREGRRTMKRSKKEIENKKTKSTQETPTFTVGEAKQNQQSSD
jgi:hypothetical protein